MVINTKLFAVTVVVVLVAMGSVATALIATSHPDTTNTVSNSINTANSITSSGLNTGNGITSTSGTTTTVSAQGSTTSISSSSTTIVSPSGSSNTTSTSTTVSQTTTAMGSSSTSTTATTTSASTTSTITTGYGISDVWSGYAIGDASANITYIFGTWMVPTVNCAVTPNAGELDWVGIADNPLAQIGTEGLCYNGVAAYYAWYEFWPEQPNFFVLDITIHPGDTINASVTGNTSSKNFTMTLTIMSSINGYNTISVSGSYSTAIFTTADWIIEQLPQALTGPKMADFNFTQFSNLYVTFNGEPLPLTALAKDSQVTTNKQIYCAAGVQAQPNQLTTAADNFSVTWTQDASC